MFGKDELIAQIQEFCEGNANALETFNPSQILNKILIDQGLFVERFSGSYSFSPLDVSRVFNGKLYPEGYKSNSRISEATSSRRTVA